MAALAPVTWVVDADAFVLVKPEPMSDPEPSIKRKRGGPAPSSGYPGVTFIKVTGKWSAIVRESGIDIFRRTFDTREGAIAAIDMYSFDKTIPTCKTGGPKSTNLFCPGLQNGTIHCGKIGIRTVFCYHDEEGNVVGACCSNKCLNGRHQSPEFIRQRKLKVDIKTTVAKAKRHAVKPTRAWGTSGVDGIIWVKNIEKWKARGVLDGKGYFLGYFDEQTAAIARLEDFYKTKIVPIFPEKTSMWKGVCWCGTDGDGGRWRAKCKGKFLGRYGFLHEDVAARAYNVEAKRIGLTELNDVPDAPVISKKDRFFKKAEKGQLYE
jgi:hypothetical protein